MKEFPEREMHPALNEMSADFKQQQLCQPCWDGDHFGRDPMNGKKISHCLRGGCQCHCTDLKPHRRKPKDKSLQMEIPNC